MERKNLCTLRHSFVLGIHFLIDIRGLITYMYRITSKCKKIQKQACKMFRNISSHFITGNYSWNP